MHKPGAVEQDVDGTELVGQGGDRDAVPHIEPTRRDKGLGEIGELVLGDVGREDIRPLGGEGRLIR